MLVIDRICKGDRKTQPSDKNRGFSKQLIQRNTAGILQDEKLYGPSGEPLLLAGRPTSCPAPTLGWPKTNGVPELPKAA